MLGMPFLFFWIVLLVMLTSVVIVYQLDPANKDDEAE